MVQLSHPYMTTEKTIDLSRWTFVGKVLFMLFNIQWLFIAESVYKTAGVPFQWHSSMSRKEGKSGLYSHSNMHLWTSLVVQWVRLHAPNAGGPGLIPGQGTRSHMPQLRVLMLQLKTRACRLQLRRGPVRQKINIFLKYWLKDKTNLCV